MLDSHHPNQKQILHYRGRFAPSPTGDLHFGSLLAAMASYAEARVHQGEWLIRIDDIDTQRCDKRFETRILEQLEKMGFCWDGTPLRQTSQRSAYQDALATLRAKNKVYPCNCTRKKIRSLDSQGIYRGYCKNRTLNLREPHTLRLDVDAGTLCFDDTIQGKYCQNLQQSCGDFVIYRADHTFSYQLCVVVDDELAGITHIVRGCDLLAVTPRQIYLGKMLEMSQPQYAHIPLAILSGGNKLSKSTQAAPLQIELEELVKAAKFLNQRVLPAGEYSNFDEFWKHLFSIWSLTSIGGMAKVI